VTPLGPDPHSEEDLANPVHADVVANLDVEVESCEQVVREESLAPDVVPSILEEEAGDQEGCSAGRTEVQDQS